jgi:multiple sugar transport system substrate-binding protein
VRNRQPVGGFSGLDDKVAASGFDLSIYGENFSQVKYDNSIYSLPYRSSVWVIAYNKTLFQERGVPLPTDDMTWDEILDLAEKMTFGEGTNKTYGLHFHNRNDDYLQVAYQNGFTLLSDDFTYVRKGMEMKLDAIQRGITMPHTEIMSTGVGVRPTFEQKVNAMYFTADWTINQMRNSLAEGVIDFEFDFIAMPHFEDKPAKQTHGSWIHTSVNVKSKKQDAAFEFVKYFAGIPGATIFAAGGTLPAAKYNEQVQAAFIGDRSQDPDNIDCLFTQTVYDPTPVVPGIKEIDAIFKEEGELVFIGEKSVDDAIESIKKRRAEVMSRHGLN